MYDASIGRFASQDRLGLDIDTNTRGQKEIKGKKSKERNQRKEIKGKKSKGKKSKGSEEIKGVREEIKGRNQRGRNQRGRNQRGQVSLLEEIKGVRSHCLNMDLGTTGGRRGDSKPGQGKRGRG